MLLRSAVSFPSLPSHIRIRVSPNYRHHHHLRLPIPSLGAATHYAISDEDLESRGFELRRTTAGLDLDRLNSVFVAVGFPRRDPEKIRVALENTELVLWVEHRRTGLPVAFARATGDGVFNAIVWDVVVDPSFQGIGLGKAVMERMVEALLGKGIVTIALYSEPRVLGFYKELGFVADPDGIRGMVYSRTNNRKRERM